MTCNEAKKISLASILEKIGTKKVKQTNREAWYLSPFRNETTASFKIDLLKNLWYDHGEGKGGNVLDFVMRYYKCELKEALQILDDESFSFHQPTFQDDSIEKEKNYEIRAIKPLTNTQLINYIQSRGISLKMAKKYSVELHYSLNDKKYFGIGFKNVLEGIEIRNRYFKGCLGTKSITLIENNCNQVILFEGWIDFLSLLILYPKIENRFNYIILNSTSQKETVPELDSNYERIYLCFDNDNTGNETTIYFQKKYENHTKDIRYLFKNHKDVNDYLINKNRV
ncbi:toprim domain-containing protein [Myroides odoratimimus]|uniref:toprim domain-containing protein n=1 Tax=Myroides odoratimimus TaxID=76832 RepID=UPI002574FC8E|nr:toprim domain-containing protein [Myroides odoratimimus]MDM1413264.1 toprim domain-containing protein [Myroides odoratimimus]MEC4006007.1 toprim domain-containing protein [Myroides odoratimimus]